MKKFLLFLTLMLSIALSVKAEDILAYQCLFGEDYNSAKVQNYTTTWTSENNNFKWTVKNFNNNQSQWAYVKCGPKETNNYEASITTQEPVPAAITKVGLLIGAITATQVGTISLEVIDAQTNAVLETKTFNKVANTQAEQFITITNPKENLIYNLKINGSNTSKTNGVLQINQISYYKDGSTSGGGTVIPDPVKPTAITFTPNGGSIETTTEISLSADGTPAPKIEYQIDGTGSYLDYETPITLSAGTHTIYAKATNEAGSVNGQAIFIVSQSVAPATITATVIMNDQSELSYGKDKEITWVSNENPNIKFSTIATITGQTYPTKSGSNLRIYNSNGNTITVSAPEDYYFVSVSAKLGTTTNHIAIDGNEIKTDNGTYTFTAGTKPTSFNLTSVASSSSNKNSDITSLTFQLGRDPKDPVEYTALNGLETQTLDYKGTKQLELGTNPPTINYAFGTSNIISIDSAGLITALAAGETTVTATWEEVPETWKASPEGGVTFNVIVNPPVLKDYEAPFKGQTYPFEMGETGKSIPVGDSHPELSFTDPNGVVEIDKHGNVEIHKAGETTVTATWESDGELWNAAPDEGVTFNVIVNKKTYTLAINSPLNLFVGDTQNIYGEEEHPELTVEVTEGDDIVSVENGVITAEEIGTATINVTWGDKNYADGSATINVTVSERPKVKDIIDEITLTTTGITSGTSTYTDWTATGEKSGVSYSGKSAGSNASVQLRSDTKNDIYSGIVSTTTKGKLKKISVDWNSETVVGRQLDIYGSNTPYTATSVLYGNNKGTLLGSIKKGTSTELVVEGEYTYIGLRSNDGAMYLSAINITWEVEDDTPALPKDVLGDIEIWVNDENRTVEEEGTLPVKLGDTIIIRAENAESIYMYSETYEKEEKEGSSLSFKADAPCKDLEVFVTASKEGQDDKELFFYLTVEKEKAKDPTFSLKDGSTVYVGDELIIDCETKGATLAAFVNVNDGKDDTISLENFPYIYTFNTTGTVKISAWADMADDDSLDDSEIVEATYTVVEDPNKAYARYTITFGDSNQDATAPLTANSIMDDEFVITGLDILDSASDISSAYKGATGLKLGKNGGKGQITLNLKEAGKVKANKVVVTAKLWNEKTSALSVNGSDAQIIDSSDLTDYVFELNDYLESITLSTSGSEYRLYVKGITVYYPEYYMVGEIENGEREEDGTEMKNEVTYGNPSYKFIYDPKQEAYILNLASIKKTDNFKIATANGEKLYSHNLNPRGEIEPLEAGNPVAYEFNLDTKEFSKLATSLVNSVFTMTVHQDESKVELMVSGNEVSDGWNVHYGNDKTMQSGEEKDGTHYLSTVNSIENANGETEYIAVLFIVAPKGVEEIWYTVNHTPKGQNVRARVADANEIKQSVGDADGTHAIVLKEGTGTVNIYSENPSLNESAEPYSINYVVTHSVPTGVEGVGAEEAEAFYYNLQGVQVKNPEKGIYIKVTGNKTEKVVL